MKTKRLTKDQTHIKDMVKFLQTYINSYDKQQGFLNYSESTVIKDILYGLGLAVDYRKYSCVSGFEAFKQFLKENYIK
jgi:hypothetical protein